jgi:hypothetical protein
MLGEDRLKATGATPPDSSELENIRDWCLAAFEAKHISDSQWDCLRLLVLISSLSETGTA